MKRINRDGFYVHLPSNASYHAFSDNKATDYTVKLATEIQLDSVRRWEVALVDIQFPTAWMKFDDGMYVEIWKGMRVGHHPVESDLAGARRVLVNIPPGKYESMDAVLVHMTKELFSYFMGEIMFYTTYNDRAVNVRIFKPGLYIRLSEKLARAFGAKNPSVIYGAGTHHLGYFVKTHVDVVHVRCNAVTPERIGSEDVSLLRAVHAKGSSTGTSVQMFKRRKYKEVYGTRYKFLRVELTTDSGDALDLASGKTVATLHFKPSV